MLKKKPVPRILFLHISLQKNILKQLHCQEDKGALGNIFAYVLLLYPLFFYLQKRREGGFQQALSNFLSKPLGPLSIAVFFMIEAVVLKPQMFELYAQTWHGFFYGLLAFFFGFLLVYSGKSFWQTASKWRWLYMGLAFVLFLLRFMLFELKSPSYLIAIESNCWIFGVFGLGYKYLNRPSSALLYLSQAAYPVYILHMFALYMGALFILPLQILLLLKFIFIIAFTGGVCYFLYEVFIRRIGFLRPLFGLKLSKR